ncbi:uncharacterized protein LOC110859431 [Folsomia candida]|uniref:Protein pinocchio n=1 Tax=Folsomia candida TaxID=158441 RepID=A0A226DEX2_FOLCA|nr:uncharacterized protein LOC110859431 [Folsomia candida]OXA42746.1 hypothetical protein Fcan01_22566 [Folsomia candida]
MTSTRGGVAAMMGAAMESVANWTLEAAGALTRVDEDEMFMFDEDLTSNNNNNNNSKPPPPPPPQLRRTSNSQCLGALVMHDLEYMTLEDGGLGLGRKFGDDDEDETLLSVSKTENTFIRPKPRFHFYGVSPADSFSAAASSVDSDLSASITIEGLRDHLQSCFTCGVLWRENQASLDCLECDGYALTRPCIDCDGSCSTVMTRDLTTSHQTHKAKWLGTCKLILRNCSIGTESVEN